MRAPQDSNDAAFGALRTGDPAGALNSRENVVPVHGIFDGIARDENVAVQVWHRGLRHDEAVAVVVENEPALYLLAVRKGRARGMLCLAGLGSLAGRIPFRFPGGEAVPPAGQLFDGAAFFELREHFEQWPAVGFLQMESASDLLSGGGFSSNLQKTQYIIGAQVYGAWHGV